MNTFILIGFLATFSIASASLAQDLKPVLQLLQPILNGLDIGLQEGAPNIRAAVQNVGATLDQTANGVADIAGTTVAGAGQTVGVAPAAVYHTLRNIDTSYGVVGAVDRTVFGKSRSHHYYPRYPYWYDDSY